MTQSKFVLVPRAAIYWGGLILAILPQPGLAQSRGLPCDVVSDDYSVEEAKRVQERVLAFEKSFEYEPPTSAFEWGGWFDDYQSETAVDAYLDTLHALAPETTRVETVGTSFEGRPIRALVFDPAPGVQDSIFVQGTQHAREWISPMVVTCIADALVRRASDERLRFILERVEIAVMPMLNPDGYAYSRSTERMWRKNRNGSGVDLNRNWDVGWDLTTSTPTSDTYPGAGPFSEPETRAASEFLKGMSQLKLFLDFHSAAQSITYPFAYTSTPPANFDDIFSWATDMAAAVTEVHGIDHGTRRTGMGGPAGGLAHDWVVEELGVIGLTPEIREGDSFSGFGMVPEEILPTCEENFAGFVALATKVAEAADPPAVDPREGSGGSMNAAGGSDTGSGGKGSNPPSSPPEEGLGGGGMNPNGPGETDGDSGSDDGGCSCRSAPRGTGRFPWWLIVPGVFLMRRRTSSRSMR